MQTQSYFQILEYFNNPINPLTGPHDHWRAKLFPRLEGYLLQCPNSCPIFHHTRKIEHARPKQYFTMAFQSNAILSKQNKPKPVQNISLMCQYHSVSKLKKATYHDIPPLSLCVTMQNGVTRQKFFF